MRLWLDPPQRKIDRDELGDLPTRSDKGKILRLATVARVTFVAGQPELTRDNLAQVVAVTAELTGSHDLGSTVAAVRKVLAAPGLLPEGVYYTLGGQELERTLPQTQALQEAALNRLRPITMSTLAMILALVPLAAAISGSGDQMLQPLAIAIIAGALVQLPLVLLAMPVVVNLTLRTAAVEG